MLLPVYCGLKYGYLYEVETGNYFLHDNEFKSYILLKGDDARIFRKQMADIDNLKDPENKTGLLTENTIKLYL